MQWVGSHLGQSTRPKGGAYKDDDSGSGQGKAPSGHMYPLGDLEHVKWQAVLSSDSDIPRGLQRALNELIITRPGSL